ncbi:hypothetical protein pneo_cds_124 [Pandoravirus neocaledonia]|uniref:Uncharacterized protein n=1 Tax=Pandoravirus neocaledonia TaxID=2107708 RepID=A0A2U7UB93_9VIRU|nr:hypothetical protein pneo_cds_124 [Pandoravirus neocaledonia]AVK75731.1 hypothetical protein pneo_cds_124 [Pandoravirus neocaledonia]
MTQQNQGSDESTAHSTAQREGVLESLLRQAGVAADVRFAFCQMPLTRVLDAFACAKCARPDGRVLCLADQVAHRKRRWKAIGHHDGSHTDSSDNDDDTTDDGGNGGGGDDDDDANRTRKSNVTQSAHHRVSLLASAGYEDTTLMGACIRALVPANVVSTVVGAILRHGRAGATDDVRVCADRQMMARHNRPPMRLCRPAARDRLRLMAWTWLDSVARERAHHWVSNAQAFGPCWEAVACPCDLSSNAQILCVGVDAGVGYCCQVDAAEMAREFQLRKDTAARGDGDSRLERIDCPYDPRIVGFIEPPFWSDEPTVFYVAIDGDARFAITAEW